MSTILSRLSPVHPARWALALVAAAAFSGPAFAQEAAKPATPQQNKMVVCQKEAGDKQLAGAERQAYVTDCLKNKPVADTKTPQQNKMVTCQKQAGDKGLAGGGRQAFVTECLKAKTVAVMPMEATAADCEKQADAQKLKGTARNKFITDCKKKTAADKKS